MASNDDLSLLPSSWFKAICQMQCPSDALDHCLLAFCAIQIHLSKEIGISYNKAVQLYNDALSRVISTLNSPFVVYSDESLAAIIILSTCEVSLYT